MTNNPLNRPPIVVVMGHIDHGKSTLLDFIRQTKIVEAEAGGITQHLGAYEVEVKGKKITFLDTPGHEAFTSIRERGATIADLAILVVSAEEGVKPQTLEALAAITAAHKPYLVAINKIDRPNANIERTKQNLAEHNILVESYGGKIPSVNISAKTGAGIDELLDLILLIAELEDLSANPHQPAEGYILEANLDPRVGVTATLIPKNGTLKRGDYVVSGSSLAKIKKLENYLGLVVESAPPSSPVKLYGFTAIPPVGSNFRSYPDKKEAEAALQTPAPTATIEAPATGEEKFLLPIVIKADVAGSLEALKKELTKLITPLGGWKIISEGLGAISENDVKLATGSNRSLVVGFNVKAEKAASDLAERLGITIETNNIIYRLSEWLEQKLEELRPKATVEVTAGEARLLKLFSRTRDKQVVGGQVLNGEIRRGREVKILRRGVEIGRGRITDLEQAKEKTNTVPAGEQFGAVIESKLTLASGDTIQTFDLVNQ